MVKFGYTILYVEDVEGAITFMKTFLGFRENLFRQITIMAN